MSAIVTNLTGPPFACSALAAAHQTVTLGELLRGQVENGPALRAAGIHVSSLVGHRESFVAGQHGPFFPCAQFQVKTTFVKWRER